ncbi:hypothetical protein Htur_5042 (plasmid) [Haloterrigena turkmenica DSM 5511]|uniref:Winged helix-turn-helix domain-containing protein n=1 Tax=Haloterrigena turkmenica (strain ATCC 51198 / DSM 5511 / JCM 9101 / NCIMB 13204 / VKM B-1734 / 4k) TaxID=543526 RepID=D2S3I3_HALTV|nr:winged helix-turn-helix domain-containing protein [Haloterrigena turkmenica]ADB63930.1 hypothetical protein Htur_5042 [Haloterrigena turkmenica DSM 5511]
MSTSKTGKTDLQRDILLTWYENPNATNKEIADACNCSASYVSEVTNRFDDYNEMEAMMDRQDREMERMFGDDFFRSMPATRRQSQTGTLPELGVTEIDNQLPNNLAGDVIQVLLVLILLYITYEIALVLVL